MGAGWVGGWDGVVFHRVSGVVDSYLPQVGESGVKKRDRKRAELVVEGGWRSGFKAVICFFAGVSFVWLVVFAVHVHVSRFSLSR